MDSHRDVEETILSIELSFVKSCIQFVDQQRSINLYKLTFEEPRLFKSRFTELMGSINHTLLIHSGSYTFNKSTDLADFANVQENVPRFLADVQRLLIWLNELDYALLIPRFVVGMPETVTAQFQRFLGIRDVLIDTERLIEDYLKQGNRYFETLECLLVNQATVSSFQSCLETLSSSLKNVTRKADQTKIKMEDALHEAIKFSDTFQYIIDWLTKAEKYLAGLQHPSEEIETVMAQVVEHETFQNDIANQREVLGSLRLGNNLRYFSQKKDLVLIKNSLFVVQQRWRRILFRASERTKALAQQVKRLTDEFNRNHIKNSSQQ